MFHYDDHNTPVYKEEKERWMSKLMLRDLMVGTTNEGRRSRIGS